MDKERFFIQSLIKQGVTKKLGDDGVVLAFDTWNATQYPNISNINTNTPNAKYLKAHKQLVIASDGFCEGIHFRREWLSLKDIAKKAMLVNLSDIIAMNAIPKYALLSITLPNLLAFEILEIVQGLAYIAKKYNVVFIGGDTTSGQNLAFHLSIIGALESKPLLRTGLQNKDLLYHTGKVGQSLYALNWLLRSGKISRSKRFLRFIEPTLREKFIYKVASFAHCGIDISDGVYSELNHLSTLNHLGIKLHKKSRLSQLSRHFLSGEEYELLFAIAPKHKHKLMRIAKSMRLHIQPIGYASKRGKKYKTLLWH